MPIITLTTDFGTADPYVGTVKGVILRLAPKATLVDITHDIPPGDIRAGGLALATACPWFPQGTIHLAVVDPGVGGSRRAVAIRTRRFWFVGPDNGLFSDVLAGEPIRHSRWLTNPALFLRPVSRTFHGRDVFAPVAARLATGLSAARLGPPVKGLKILTPAAPRRLGSGLAGEVARLDRFGNAITNLPWDQVAPLLASHASVWVGRRRIPVGTCYESVGRGRPVALAGSSGCLEVAVHLGSAARRLRLRPGSRVMVRV